MTIHLSKTPSPANRLGEFTLDHFKAVLFDLDGVLTSTAVIHAACWKQTFDEFLQIRSVRAHEPFRPFEADDYKRFVDGRPCYEGVRSFLASRGITLPDGAPGSPPDEDSFHGLGNRKDALFKRAIHAQRIQTFPDSIDFVRWIRALGLKTAVVSSSRNCNEILKITGTEDLFDAEVDGQIADELRLRGKPAPGAYLHGKDLLHVLPLHTVVVEDAIAGVQAGRAGGFGFVVGINRGGSAEELRRNAADVVVSTLSELRNALGRRRA